ncbi:MAG: hypothetical protein J6D00_05330 [Christensenellaceae bacterium]|nr:hypothetical protein [Christensenellaceae bacterium]
MSLSYFPPGSGAWNLAHIVTQLPESTILFATPSACSRIIALSSLEKGLPFHCLDLSMQELTLGLTEEKILEAVPKVLEKSKAKALFIFTACVDTFIGSDHEIFLAPLREQYPDVLFIDARMDPINRATMPPIVRMHISLSENFKKTGEEKAVNILGSFIAPDDDQELVRHLKKHGFEVRHMQNMKTLEEHSRMGNSMLNLLVCPVGMAAVKALQERLGQPFVNLCGLKNIEELTAVYDDICDRLGIPHMDMEAEQKEAQLRIGNAADKLNGRPVVIGGEAHNHAGMIAEALHKNGISILRLFDSERKDEHFENIDTEAVEQAKAFAEKRFFAPEAVAVGDTAIYFTGTKHFYRQIRFNSHFGLYAAVKMAEELAKAANMERDPREIQKKGHGCSAL